MWVIIPAMSSCAPDATNSIPAVRKKSIAIRLISSINERREGFLPPAV